MPRAGEGGERGAGDAESGEGPEAEDEAGIEDEVEDVGDPEQAHGDGGVSGTAEDGIIEKEQENHAGAAERDAGVVRAGGYERGRAAHDCEKLRREQEEGQTESQGGKQAEEDGLDGGDGGALGIFLADAARDHGGGGHAEAHSDSEDEGENGLGEADGGDSVGAEAGDEKDVDDGEEAFEDHLKDHGDGEQEDGAVEAAGGVVLVRAAKGLLDGLPERGRRRGGEDGFHASLCLRLYGCWPAVRFGWEDVPQRYVISESGFVPGFAAAAEKRVPRGARNDNKRCKSNGRSQVSPLREG